MDKTCWFCGDFSACWCGKINIEGGCFIEGDAHIGMLGAWAPDSARGPDKSHVGPRTRTWARWVVARTWQVVIWAR